MQHFIALEDLDEEVVFGASNPNYAKVKHGSFVWAVIMKNAVCNKNWKEFAEEIQDIDNKMQSGDFVELPECIVRVVYDGIKEKLLEIEHAQTEVQSIFLTEKWRGREKE